MTETEKILEQIDFEMSKMLGKSKNKMTNAEFRAFVSEKWEQMDESKYQIHDAYILIGRMMNEAIWAKDPADLLKWVKKSKKHQSGQKNPLNVRYNYYKNKFLECGAFAEGLAFFKSEATAESAEYEAFFQNILDNPELMQQYLEAEDDDLDMFDFKSVELPQWQVFFDEEDTEIGYEVLRKDGETTDRETQKHKNGLAYLKENQMPMLNAILGELLKQYPSIQDTYKDFYSKEQKAEFLPDISDIQGFATLLSPTSIFVFSEYQDDIPYLGISFHCMWDSEHGLGVLICKDRVVAIGSAEMAFDTFAVKKDVKERKK
ncbi:hypothetical protein [Capnocytophaga sp.]|uniref:DUF6985 domain-containing protein n=1 Tax=Capnocytophaga sp. TaxID=44737 RepID=UPI0026DD34F7|nr:hypothetical protein [Capnocytophaga sp.]MDO5106147.1 hypothetical protein [Capnocytophaga sp.]